MKTFLKLLWLIPVFIFCFPLSCAIITIPIFSVVENSLKKKIEGVPPPAFPILVLVQDLKKTELKANILEFRNLNSFLQAHPNYSFFVDPNDENYISNQLENFPGFHRPSLKVTQISKEKQFIEIKQSPDGDRRIFSSYEATKKEVYPQYFNTYLGPAVSIVAGIPAFIITLVLWMTGFIFYKKKKKQTSQQAKLS